HVPVADRRMIAAGGQLEAIVVVVADERARDVDVEIVVNTGDVELAEEAEFPAERRRDVADQVAEAEAVMRLAIAGAGIVGAGEMDVGEAAEADDRPRAFGAGLGLRGVGRRCLGRGWRRDPETQSNRAAQAPGPHPTS